MKYILGLLMIIVLGLATFYAHKRLHAQISKVGQRLFAHGLLLTVGLAFAWAMASVYTRSEEGGEVLVFLYGFGIVHVPAALILWLKKQQY